MSLAPQDIVRVRLPALYGSADLQVYLQMAQARTNPTIGGSGWSSADTWATAVALRAMHTYILSTTRGLGEAGSIGGKKEGELSLNFASQSRSAKIAPPDIDLEQTVFGRELMGLMRGTFVKFAVAGEAVGADAWGGY